MVPRVKKNCRRGNLPVLEMEPVKRSYVAILFVILGCAKPAPAPKDSHGFHHRFDDAARWSRVFDDPSRDAWQKPARVVELVGASEGMTVADVGAGTGYFEPWLSRSVGAKGQVIAVDVEPSMVRWIEDRARREGTSNVVARLARADEPGLAQGSVDRILVVDTWHHLDRRVAYAGKLRTALRDGGSVWVVDFTKQSPHGPPPHARVEAGEVVRELAAAGLTARVVEDAGLPHQYVVVGTRP